MHVRVDLVAEAPRGENEHHGHTTTSNAQMDLQVDLRQVHLCDPSQHAGVAIQANMQV
jgi:hypothetical protein